MQGTQNTAPRRALSTGVFASLALLVGGFAFISQDFGYRSAALLSLLLALPLVVAVRLRRRWPAVRDQELAFLAVRFCVAAGTGAYLVQAWYADGLDRDHAEDVRWAEFERRVRQEPAFQDIQVHKLRKNIHWASGTVTSVDDLVRLRSLAVECGIEGRLDGPFAASVSLTVKERSGEKAE